MLACRCCWCQWEHAGSGRAARGCMPSASPCQLGGLEGCALLTGASYAVAVYLKHVCIYMCIYIYVCIYISVYIYMYIYISIYIA